MKACKLCPSWEKDERYGKVQRACRGLAEEVVSIVKNGGPFKSMTANRVWRNKIALRKA
jgi:hypothetical protein